MNTHVPASVCVCVCVCACVCVCVCVCVCCFGKWLWKGWFMIAVACVYMDEDRGYN